MILAIMMVGISGVSVALPIPAESFLSKAQKAANMGKYRVSSELYTKAMQAGADSLVCLQALADNAMELGDYPEVVRVCPQIRALDPWVPYTYNYQAQANAALGNLDSATNDVLMLVELVGIDNDSYEAMTAVSDCDLNKMANAFRFRKAQETENPVWDRCLGTIFTYARLYDKASEAFLNALKLDPRSDEDMESLALLYNQMRQYETALYYASKAIEVNPSKPDYFNNKAIILRNAGQMTNAVALLDTALSVSPSCASYYTTRGLLRASQGEYAAAIEDYDSSLKAEPQSPATILRKGIALSKIGEKKAAKREFRKVVNMGYNHWSGTALAQAYLGNRRAVDAYIKYATQQKRRVDNYFSMAAMSDVLNRPHQAIKYIELALKENALNPDILQYDLSLNRVKHLSQYHHLVAAYGD